MDLTPYKSNPVLIRFRLASNQYPADGWYIDDVEIKEKDTAATAFPFSDNFENGLANWVVSGQDWGIIDTDKRSGTHSITDSPSGNYPTYANTTIELAHPVDLSAATTPMLSFWHKSYFNSSIVYDDIYVDISQDGGVTWTDLTLLRDSFVHLDTGKIGFDTL